MLFPIQLAAFVAGFGQRTGAISAALVVFLLVGTFLSYKGYTPEERCRERRAASRRSAQPN
jgi:hypothetical protein